MKIEMLVDEYAAVNGLRLKGAGVHDVPSEKAQYLLTTFPDWFRAASQNTEEQTGKDESEQLEGSAEEIEGESEQSAPSDEPEATQGESEQLAPTKTISKMNKAELTALGAELGLELTDDMTANQMKEAIKSAQEAA